MRRAGGPSLGAERRCASPTVPIGSGGRKMNSPTRWAAPQRRGRIPRMTGKPTSAEHLQDLARLRRVRDRIDREYAQPLDVEALARGAHMSAGHLSRQFRLAFGESPY